MKAVIFLCVLVIVAAVAPHPAVALDRAQYRTAERVFYSYDEKQRYEVPLLLIAAGHFNAMSNGSFGPRLFNSIQSYQSAVGGSPTGWLTSDQLARLQVNGYGVMAAWGMTEVRNPFTDAKLFVPKKIAPLQQATGHGYTFDAYNRSISVDFSFFPPSERTLEDVYARLTAAGGGRRIDYKVLRPAFLAVAGGIGDRAFYSKYQIARGGVVGFTVNWDPGRIERGDRIPNLMANLFFAPLYGGADTAAQAAYTPPTAPVIPEPAPQPAAPPPVAEAPKPEPRGEGGSGTGFFVTQTRLLTNAHVVKGCTTVTLKVGQEQASGRVLAKDERNDLALVESSKPNEATAKLRAGVRLGEDVAAFGFPLNGLLATSGNFTRGGVTATAGLLDDSSQIQISAPVQPGNSGGPLLDETGNVVGVVVSKLKVLQVAVLTGDFAQNVNFAIKASVAQTFLEANSTTFDSGAVGEAMKPADLAGRAQSVAAVIECRP
jgi:S1-C subfamily serine protease